MSKVLRTSLLALSLLASAAAFTSQSASAERVIIEEPVIVSPGYQPYSAPPPPPAYWGATEYIGPRPFSLHRFVGNAVGGSLGATKHVVLGSHHDRYYYY